MPRARAARVSVGFAEDPWLEENTSTEPAVKWPSEKSVSKTDTFASRSSEPTPTLHTVVARQDDILRVINAGFATIQARLDEMSLQQDAPVKSTASLLHASSRSRMSLRSSIRKSTASRAAVSPLNSIVCGASSTSLSPKTRPITPSRPSRLYASAPQTRDFKRHRMFEFRHEGKLRNSTDYAKDETGANRPTVWRSMSLEFNKSLLQKWKSLHPDSRKKLYWDSLSIFVVLWDLVFVPYFFAWSFKGGALVLLSGFFVCTFWTFDIPINFCCGYYTRESEAERRLSQSALRYLKTWFFLDFTLATLDWVSLTLDDETAAWAFYAQQIFRICKLGIRVPSKLPRAKDLYARFLLRIQSKNIHSMLDILRLLFLLFLSNHVLACSWYFVGRHPFLCGEQEEQNFCGETWLNQPQMQGRHASYHYLSALHWCVTQMTPASMEVVPENGGERLFTIVIIIIGLMLSVSLIATMTSIVTAIRVEMDSELKKKMQLQRFLTQNKVPDEFGLLVMRQVKWRLQQKVRLKTSDVAYISFTSRSLQRQLKYQIYMHQLYHHNFFAASDSAYPLLTRVLCDRLKVDSMAKDEVLFEESYIGVNMYIISLGAAEYAPGQEAYEYGKHTSTMRIPATTWCSEPALWLEDWFHVGTATMAMQSEVLSLDVEMLVEISKKYSDLLHWIDVYSKAFEEYSNQAPGISDCAALYDPADVFYGLRQTERLKISGAYIERMQADTSKYQKHKFDKLREEIEAGKCNISMVPGIGIVRTVFLAAVRITLPLLPRDSGVDADEPLDLFEGADYFESLNSLEGSEDNYEDANSQKAGPRGILCEVAEFDEKANQYKSKCVMPGSKRREMESAVGALQRLLKGDLQQLAQAGLQIDYQSPDNISFTQDSPTYGVYSKYIKLCFNGVLSDEGADMLPQVAAVSPESWTAIEESRTAAREAAAESKWSWHQFFKQSQVDAWIEKAVRAEQLLKRFTSIISLDNGKRLYLWLTPDEMDLLSQKESAIVLNRWAMLYDDKEELRASRASTGGPPLPRLPKPAVNDS